MIKDGMLRSAGEIADILGKSRLRKLSFEIPKGKVTTRQAVMLSRVEEEMSPTSDVANADDIELQKIMENVARSMENLTAQLEGESSEDLPMHELLGLDKQLRIIRGSLKVEVAKRFSWEKESRKKSISLRKFKTIQNMRMAFEKTSSAESPS